MSIGWVRFSTDGMRTAAGFLNALWSASFEQFLVLALPWLFVFLLSRRRLLTAVPCIGLAVLCGWLIGRHTRCWGSARHCWAVCCLHSCTDTRR